MKTLNLACLYLKHLQSGSKGSRGHYPLMWNVQSTKKIQKLNIYFRPPDIEDRHHAHLHTHASGLICNFLQSIIQTWRPRWEQH